MNLTRREIITTSLVILACLVLFSVFPTNNIFQEIISSATFFFVVPVLYVKIILKKEPSQYGFGLGDYKKGIMYSAMSLIISLLVMYILFNYFSFTKNYQLPQRVSGSFQFFILYEVVIVGFFTALYELFFRGFVQFSFVEKLGFWVIPIQAGLFVLLFLLSGSLSWSIAPFIVIAPFSGYAVLKSRSVLYSFLSTVLFIIIIDAIVIRGM